MPALVAGIHVFGLATRKTWMAGTSPAMTIESHSARIFSSTGKRYDTNFSGSSLIGKWPSPFMMVAGAPVRLAMSRVASAVQE